MAFKRGIPLSGRKGAFLVYNAPDMFFPLKRSILTVLAPVSQDEDQARSEFILNVLLAGSIFLTVTALTINLIKGFLEMRVPVSVGAISISLAFFSSCYLLSRKGHARIASYALLGLFFLFTSYMNYRWGVDLPTGLLTYSLVIVMSGILISSRFAFGMTAGIAATIVLIQFLQRIGVGKMDQYWRLQPWETADSIVTIIMFSLIASVCWLSNREIEKSLIRARRSEADLKQERDSLEIKVDERTRELKEVQAEKIGQLYRFAEFGRLSSGLFHDLINPLSAISLNVGKLQQDRETADTTRGVEGETINRTANCVQRAVHSARNLENLVNSVRKQLARQETRTMFSVNEEIAHVIDILSHKARLANVEVVFIDEARVQLFGDAVKFNQVLLNLIANAIDAYADMPPKDGNHPRSVVVVLRGSDDSATFSVVDYGVGIPAVNRSRIFEPFFTTKTEGHGIGLSLTKRIIEKDFHGTIAVESEERQGTVFTLTIPLSSQSATLSV